MIDYAGLFPPAQLQMSSAVSEYAGYMNGEDRDLLGRFIVSAARLDELAGALSALPPQDALWSLGVTGGENPAETLREIERFKSAQRHSRTQKAICTAVEMPVSSEDAIVAAANAFSAVELFLEIALDENMDSLIALLAGTGAAAKMRTGGITESAFPPAQQVFEFLQSCFERNIPFKVTAGLHHALRGDYSLTYDVGSASATMFGYLNVFLAAVYLSKQDGVTALRVLEEEQASAFEFDEYGVNWRGNRASWTEMEAARRLARSFGSCSFTEPVAEARELEII